MTSFEIEQWRVREESNVAIENENHTAQEELSNP